MPSRKSSSYEHTKPENSGGGCGCASIPLSLILVMLGAGYWGFTQVSQNWGAVASHLGVDKLLPSLVPTPAPSENVPGKASANPPAIAPSTVAASPQPRVSTTPKLAPSVSPNLPVPSPKPTPAASPQPRVSTTPKLAPSVSPNLPIPSPKPTSQAVASAHANWERKAIRGIYLSRYQVTNNASEQVIRERVRYYRQKGFNTIIHGVWGNGCTMYKSRVLQETFGIKSCPNQFRERWLEWLIDEAHKQDMQVHAYFEKGIKIDKNSPIFDIAVAKRWIVPGIDKTYAGIEHYVLDVEIPEVAKLFRAISVEFVQKYPTVDAVQWDDYLGYHADLPGKVDRTTQLTTFVRQMRADIKNANPTVKFDLCHHNPYWSKRYFAADWQSWGADRIFIQTYNDANFNQELEYARKYAGVAISDQHLHRLKPLIQDQQIKSILIFPSAGNPENAANLVKTLASTGS
jgi:uncharacterized lipoprotein YddW (UPF0748 family)